MSVLPYEDVVRVMEQFLGAAAGGGSPLASSAARFQNGPPSYGLCSGGNQALHAQIKSALAGVTATPESYRSEQERVALSHIRHYLTPSKAEQAKARAAEHTARQQQQQEQEEEQKDEEEEEPPYVALAKERKNLNERKRYAAKKRTIEEIRAKLESQRTAAEREELAKAFARKRQMVAHDSQRYVKKKRALQRITATPAPRRTPQDQAQLSCTVARKKQKCRVDSRWIAKRRAEERQRWAGQKAARAVGEPSAHDVLLGKGREQHPGNRTYRRLVEHHKAAYTAAVPAGREAVADEILRYFGAMDPPGRFLEQDAATRLWYDVGDGKARAKALRAMSRKTPKAKKSQSGTGATHDAVPNTAGCAPPPQCRGPPADIAIPAKDVPTEASTPMSTMQQRPSVAVGDRSPRKKTRTTASPYPAAQGTPLLAGTHERHSPVPIPRTVTNEAPLPEKALETAYQSGGVPPAPVLLPMSPHEEVASALISLSRL